MTGKSKMKRARTRWQDNRDVMIPVILLILLAIAFSIIFLLAGR